MSAFSRGDIVEYVGVGYPRWRGQQGTVLGQAEVLVTVEAHADGRVVYLHEDSIALVSRPDLPVHDATNQDNPFPTRDTAPGLRGAHSPRITA